MTGIYVHIPFCLQKCNYCDFCSYPSMLHMAGEYCEAVKREAESFKKEDIFIDTIYFGGGTPSILETEHTKMIMDAVSDSFNIYADAEITIEANPGTITSQKAHELFSMGFNRVSLGAQSFCDDELLRLGRIHSSSQTIGSYKLLREAGFKNISLDLMYAIPSQTIATLEQSISELVSLEPEHISCYGLKIEEGTPFSKMLERGEITEKSDDEYADMYDIIRQRLSQAGYLQYELSNFSKKGYESRHNTKYWTGKNYIGLGAGAASKIGCQRYTHTSNLQKYISFFENDESYELTKEDAMSEFMFLGLRLTQRGVSKEEFKKLFGVGADEIFAKAIKKHISNKMLIDTGDRYILAPEAYYVSNYVLSDFV